MHYLSLLVIVLVFVFLGCIGLVKLTCDLWQMSIHESPAIPDILVIFAPAEGSPAGGSVARELSPTELNARN
jgi:hypothetical protein